VFAPIPIRAANLFKVNKKHITTIVITFYGVSIMSILKIIQTGNSLGVILPEEFLAKMKLEKGDELFVIETPLGLSLSKNNPDLNKQLGLGES
jgi:putative addiction module antidote